MKKLIIISIILTIGSMISPSLFADTIGSARINLMEGNVIVQTKDTGSEWIAAAINIPLLSGDRIWIPENGRSEIQFLNGSYIRADQNTGLDITKLNRDSEGDITQVAVSQGRAYIYCHGSADSNLVFQVDTPLVSATAYGSAIFDVCVHEDGYTEISVIKGTALVQGERVNTKVYTGDMILVRTDNYAELSPRRADDSWLSWNLSRDSLTAGTGTSTRYLPASLYSYSADFDHYGRWVHTPDYGYVWSPRITITTWAPYRHGRWIWRNRDYVWVSYEPWGWAPYHYGRWGFTAGTGWFWVPPALNDVYWGPGFVAWVNTPTYVAWVPLAPREMYYGHGHYGRHSINVATGNINDIHLRNVYLNSRVAHGVTVVHHDTFITGRHLDVRNAPANPFDAGLRVSAGRPSIRQTNYSPLPSVEPRVTPQASNQMQHRELRNTPANSTVRHVEPRATNRASNQVQSQEPINAAASDSAIRRVEPRATTRVSNQVHSQESSNAPASNSAVRHVEPEATPQVSEQVQTQEPNNTPARHSTFRRVEPRATTRVNNQMHSQESSNAPASNSAVRHVEPRATTRVSNQVPSQESRNTPVRHSTVRRVEPEATPQVSNQVPSQEPNNAPASNSTVRRVEPEATPQAGDQVQSQGPGNAFVRNSGRTRRQ